MIVKKSVKERREENKIKIQKEKGAEKVCPHCGDSGCAGAEYHPDDCPFVVYSGNEEK